MLKNLLTLSFLLLNTPLFSIDINDRVTIITEATEATETLQNEFEILVHEMPTPIPIGDTENFYTPASMEVINIANVPKIIPSNTIEKEIDEISKINSTKRVSCIKEKNHTKKTNKSLPDDGCTDTEVEGKSIQGLIIFKTRIKPHCKMNGNEFAKQYAQEDWEDIFYEKEFKLEVFRACPQIEKRYKDKWTPHLYQFTLEYASDSDAIPEC